MFDIGWSEILLIAIVAIVVVGPKDLPPMLRAAGRMVSRLRKTAGEFQSQFNEALREAELDGVKDSINEIRGLNPMNEIRKSLDPIQAALAKPEGMAKPAPAPVPPPANQLAQPMTDADLMPAASPLPVDRPVETAEAKPAPRKRKPKAVAGDADAAPVAVTTPAKRATKPKAVAVDADSVAPTVEKKPRALRAKPASLPRATVEGPSVPIAAAAAAPTGTASATALPTQVSLPLEPSVQPVAEPGASESLASEPPATEHTATKTVALPSAAPAAEERS